VNAYGFTVFLGKDKTVGYQLGRSVRVIAAKPDDAMSLIDSTFNDILTLEGPVEILEDALIAPGVGGVTVPGDPPNSVQFNNGGSFGGDAFVTWIHPTAPNVNATLLLVGDTNNAATLEIHNPTSNNVRLYTHSDDYFRGPSFILARSRGTQAAPTPLVIGDYLGYISLLGWNGTSYVNAAWITVQAGSGGFSGTTNATTIEIIATPPSSTVPIEVLRLCNTAGVNLSGLPFGATQNNPIGFATSSNQVLDTALSRLAANSMALGNGTQGDASGSLQLASALIQTGTSTIPLEVHSSGTSTVQSIYAHNNSFGASVLASRSRGTQSVPTAVQSSDVLGYYTWQGYDGTAYQQGAQIQVQANGTFAAGNRGSVIEFFAVAGGSTALVEVLRLQNTAGINASSLSFGVISGQALGIAGGGPNNALDVAVSRLGPASMALGNGTAGDFSGSLKLTQETIQGTGQTGAASGVQPLEIHNSNNGIGGFYAHGNGINGPQLSFYLSQGTQAAPTAVAAQQFLGWNVYRGYDGSGYQDGASMGVQAVGAWTGTNHAAAFIFSACLPNSTVLSEIVRFPDFSGNFEISNGHLAISSTSVSGWRQNAVSNSPMDTGFSRVSPASVALGNGTLGDVSGVLLANGGVGVSLKATALLSAGVPVKADVSNANQVVPTTTTDTGAGVVIGVAAAAVAAGNNGPIVTTGVVAMVLGTGTAAIGQFVVVDTTTNGRVKCTSTYTAGTIIGVAMSAQGSVGGSFNVMVGLR